MLDAKSGLPVFPEFSVPGMPEGTRFDQFPGAPSLDGGMVAFKGNFTDPESGVGKTGVFFRQVFDGPTQATHRIASSDTVIPGQAKGGEVRFGSTASPSAADGQLVFLGLDNEDAPTMGGIYLAPIAQDPALLPLAEIGGAVPGVESAVFNRLGEAAFLRRALRLVLGRVGRRNPHGRARVPERRQRRDHRLLQRAASRRLRGRDPGRTRRLRLRPRDGRGVHGREDLR